MNIARFRPAAISALAVLLISGAGIAFAANSSPAAPVAPAAQATAVAPAATSQAPVVVAPAEPTAEPAGSAAPETDTIQQGDQTTPDTAAGTAAEPAGTETEKAGAEEPGDANLPGGGHADNPSDPNADHQFEGVE
jgi:hypothetical protein